MARPYYSDDIFPQTEGAWPGLGLDVKNFDGLRRDGVAPVALHFGSEEDVRLRYPKLSIAEIFEHAITHEIVLNKRRRSVCSIIRREMADAEREATGKWSVAAVDTYYPDLHEDWLVRFPTVWVTLSFEHARDAVAQALLR